MAVAVVLFVRNAVSVVGLSPVDSLVFFALGLVFFPFVGRICGFDPDRIEESGRRGLFLIGKKRKYAAARSREEGLF